MKPDQVSLSLCRTGGREQRAVLISLQKSQGHGRRGRWGVMTILRGPKVSDQPRLYQPPRLAVRHPLYLEIDGGLGRHPPEGLLPAECLVLPRGCHSQSPEATPPSASAWPSAWLPAGNSWEGKLCETRSSRRCVLLPLVSAWFILSLTSPLPVLRAPRC